MSHNCTSDVTLLGFFSSLIILALYSYRDIPLHNNSSSHFIYEDLHYLGNPFPDKKLRVNLGNLFCHSSLTEVRGTVKFLLPFIEVGAQCRKVMNVSTHVEGSIQYNTVTGAFKDDMKLPKDLREIMYFTTETYHYIKTSKEPLRKVVVEPDQLGKVLLSK